jgi:hypothetical protein
MKVVSLGGDYCEFICRWDTEYEALCDVCRSGVDDVALAIDAAVEDAVRLSSDFIERATNESLPSGITISVHVDSHVAAVQRARDEEQGK